MKKAKKTMEELDRISVSEYKNIQKNPFVVVLDNVRSAHNVGSVFRTCDAFRIEKIYLCGITPTPPNHDIHKTALGATDTVNWEYFKDTLSCIKELKKMNYEIIAIEQANNSILLNKYEKKSENDIALVFGHEVYGVEQEIIDFCDSCIEIPQEGTKHSLNIAVSVGILTYKLCEKYII